MTDATLHPNQDAVNRWTFADIHERWNILDRADASLERWRLQKERMEAWDRDFHARIKEEQERVKEDARKHTQFSYMMINPNLSPAFLVEMSLKFWPDGEHAKMLVELFKRKAKEQLEAKKQKQHEEMKEVGKGFSIGLVVAVALLIILLLGFTSI